jgi:hypothetical protein
MALKLDILANTRELVTEMRKGGASIEEISDALDIVAREGRDAGGKVESSLQDLQRQAGKTERAVKDIGDGGAINLRKIGDGAREAQQELGQNLGETVSSIRGDLSDLGQVGQDTLGGLAATLASGGPAGIAGAALLAAGALGLGAVTAEMQKQQEEADKLRERISGAYQGAADDGRAYLDVAQLIAEANSLMFDPERAEEYKRIREDAKRLGLEEATVIDANAGSLDAQKEVLERINELRDELNDKPRQQGIAGTAEWDAEKKAIDDIEQRWTNANEVSEQYADTAKKASEAAAQRHAEERDQIERTARVAGERDEGLAAKYGMPITAKVKVDDSEVQEYARNRVITINGRLRVAGPGGRFLE